MGSRDYRKRETKKQKKDGKKVAIDEIVVSTTEAEVIRKPRKGRPEEEDAQHRRSELRRLVKTKFHARLETPGRQTVAVLACLNAVISGRVQGVFYRDFVSRRAVGLGLSGYVRNLADGESVEVRAEGDRENLEKLLGYLRAGPPAARVDEVAVRWQAYTGNFTGFSVRYQA